MSDGRVTVYDLTTGATLLRWSVDAREMVAAGGYSFTAPAVDPVAAIAESDDIEPEAAHTSRVRKGRR